jgi:hypothetical protein
MALKCYFDGSGKRGRSLTLACVAGDEQAWAGLEADWKSFLEHVGIDYTHMYEAISRKGPFKGWQKDKRDWFVNGLIFFIEEHQHKNPSRLKAFTSTVDLVAHNEVAGARYLPSPARMCMRGLFAKVFEWYAAFPDTILDAMELFFDKDEAFMRHIDDDWKAPAIREKYPSWGLVRSIEPVDMKATPGIQVADLFAWSRTRIDKKFPDKFYGPALRLCHPTGADHYIFDRAKLLTYPRFAIM